MPYTTIADVKTVLKPELFDYPADVDDEILWAESEVNSVLGSVYQLRFDDATKYDSVPEQVRWATALLTAYRLWDRAVALEGQQDDTAAEKWRAAAMATLTALKDGDTQLTLADGTVITTTSGGSPIRYPDYSSETGYPFFKRENAHEW